MKVWSLDYEFVKSSKYNIEIGEEYSATLNSKIFGKKFLL
jgi:hypothetical protein